MKKHRHPKVKILSTTEREQVGLLIQAGILKPFRAEHLRPTHQFSSGFVFVGCSDGSVSSRIRAKCHSICKDVGAVKCVHCVQNGGGALLVPRDTPIRIPALTPEQVSAFIQEQVAIGVTIKNLPAILLTAHAPCAAAEASGLTIFEMVRTLMNAKTTVRGQYPRHETFDGKHVVIVPALLLQFSQKRCDLYYVCIEQWRRYLDATEALEKPPCASTERAPQTA